MHEPDEFAMYVMVVWKCKVASFLVSGTRHEPMNIASMIRLVIHYAAVSEVLNEIASVLSYSDGDIANEFWDETADGRR